MNESKDKQTVLDPVCGAGTGPIHAIITNPPYGIRRLTKEEVIKRLRDLKSEGWVLGGRPGNDGSVGNTVEDYLGIEENNFQTADAGEWELKAQRKTTSSMITLFHIDPNPRKPLSVVAQILLPNYGWPHKTLVKEFSFRATLNGKNYTDRGFIVKVDRKNKRVNISFNSHKVDVSKHSRWLTEVKQKKRAGEINPQPFWTFEELEAKTSKKIKNTFFINADVKIEKGEEYFKYDEILELSNFDFKKFLKCIENGVVLIDFDARTGHNHGTKFRIKQGSWPKFFDVCKKIE